MVLIKRQASSSQKRRVITRAFMEAWHMEMSQGWIRSEIEMRSYTEGFVHQQDNSPCNNLQWYHLRKERRGAGRNKDKLEGIANRYESSPWRAFEAYCRRGNFLRGKRTGAVATTVVIWRIDVHTENTPFGGWGQGQNNPRRALESGVNFFRDCADETIGPYASLCHVFLRFP